MGKWHQIPVSFLIANENSNESKRGGSEKVATVESLTVCCWFEHLNLCVLYFILFELFVPSCAVATCCCPLCLET
jgi:hypothetical protein